MDPIDGAGRRLADGEGVGEAHLYRLVDDEDIDRVGHHCVRPQPDGAPGEGPPRRRQALRPPRRSVRALDDALVRTAVGGVRLFRPAGRRPRRTPRASRSEILDLLADGKAGRGVTAKHHPGSSVGPCRCSAGPARAAPTGRAEGAIHRTAASGASPGTRGGTRPSRSTAAKSRAVRREAAAPDRFREPVEQLGVGHEPRHGLNVSSWIKALENDPREIRRRGRRRAARSPGHRPRTDSGSGAPGPRVVGSPPRHPSAYPWRPVCSRRAARGSVAPSLPAILRQHRGDDAGIPSRPRRRTASGRGSRNCCVT